MLIKCTKQELEKYIDFVYGLALDLTKSGYPIYCDGIKTKSMFIECLLKAFERDDEEIPFIRTMVQFKALFIIIG